MDALGNATWRRSGEGVERGHLPSYGTTYKPGTGQVIRIEKQAPEQPTNTFYPEITTRTYDASGNMTHGMQEIHGSNPHSVYAGPVRIVNSRSYYAADERLRYFQESDISTSNGIEFKGVWEEYRYDALGRRILVHSNRNHLCGGSETECTSHVTRMVWSGDQLLWELRARAQPTDDLEAESTSGDFYGVVSYTHAGGIDRPLAIHKRGQPVIIPHENWRGQFARGTDLQGRVIDCPEGGTPTPTCIRLAWPGHRTTAWHLEARAPDVVTWYGGLVDGMRDASGQMYMRNRYYDPATGQFTQPDPIGLAGGLNAYGFAAGDPVSYTDPYGLKVCLAQGTSAQQRDWFQQGLQDATNTTFTWDASGCVDQSSIQSRGGRGYEKLLKRFMKQVEADEVFTLAFKDGGWGTHYEPSTRTVNIDPDDPGNLEFVANRGICNPFTNISVVASPGAILAHELLGHGSDGWLRAMLPPAFGFREGNARRMQNRYHRARGEPHRC